MKKDMKNLIIIVLNNTFHKYCFWLFVVLFISNSAKGEGTKQFMPNSANPTVFDIDNPNSKSRFASYYASAEERLFFDVSDFTKERIYWGTGPTMTSGAGTITQNFGSTVTWRIKDPLGNTVASGNLPTAAGTGYIDTYTKAILGPSTLVAGGYTPNVFNPTMNGHYYIEFGTAAMTPAATDNFRIGYFDLTVANTTTNTAIDGRLWSKSWAFSTLGGNNPCYSQFYIYTKDSIVNKFSMNGAQPYGFAFNCNSAGVSNTGNIAVDRQSITTAPSYKGEFPIFLQDPDNNLYPTGQIAEVKTMPKIFGCPSTSSYCIDMELTKDASGEIYLELNGTPGFQPNTQDRILSQKLIKGKNCVAWDGKDGLGNNVSVNTFFTINISLVSGLTNYPIYDDEFNPNGFIVGSVRPIMSFPTKMYWDDLAIPYGTSNFIGLTGACNAWTTTPDDNGGSTAGFGNNRALNRWWYAMNINQSYQVEFKITPNCPPVTTALALSTNENTTKTGSLSSNVTDNAGDILSFERVTNITTDKGGKITIDANGNYSYTPPLNYNGLDHYTYSVCDNAEYVQCSTGEINITVLPINNPPIALADYNATKINTAVSGNVISNDYDPDGNTITATGVANATTTNNGKITIFTDGSYSYTPATGFTGTDTYTYTVCDNIGLCSSGSITVYVTSAGNTPPVPADDYCSINEDNIYSGNVKLNDADDGGYANMTVQPVVNATTVDGGKITINTNGTFIYTPPTDYYGNDTYVYTICDAGSPSLCSTATIHLTVKSVNDPPVAVDDLVKICQNTPVSGNLKANDYDDGGFANFSVKPVTNARTANLGLISIDASGNFLYTPPFNYSGPDSYLYTIQDQGDPALSSYGFLNILVDTKANAGRDQTFCQSAMSSTVLAATKLFSGTGTWSQVSGPNTAVIADVNAYNTGISGLALGTYVFRWTVSGGLCSASTDDVNIILTAATSAASVTTPLNICDANSGTLTGNNPAVGTGSWKQFSGPNTATITNPALYNSTVTNLVTGTYVFRWLIKGACSTSYADLTVNVNKANAGADQSICNLSSVSLSGNTGTGPTYAWSKTSGPGTQTYSPNATSQNVTVNSLTIPGAYVFQYSLKTTTPNCTSTDQVNVNVYANATATAGSSQTICNTSATFAATAPGTLQTGTWSQVSGPNTATIATPNSATSIVTGLVYGIYVFKWTVTSGVCGTASNTIQIKVTKPFAGADLETCGATSVILSGSAPGSGNTGTWSKSSGPGTPTYSPNTTSQNVTINGLSAGTYIFSWTITGTGCSGADQVQVINSALPTTASANVDIDLCNLTTATMAANTPTTGSGVWSKISGVGTPVITTPTSPTTTITGLTAGTTYIYRWTISSTGCSSSSDEIQITTSTSDPVNAGLDQTLCGIDNSAFLTTGTGLWSQISGPATAVITNPNLATSTVTGITTTGDYMFRWTTTLGHCFDDMIIHKLATPSISAGSNPTTICIGTTVNLTASGGSTYSWLGPNNFTSSLQNPSITNATSANDGTYIVTVKTASGCVASASTNVSIITSPIINLQSSTQYTAVNTDLTFNVGNNNLLTISDPQGDNQTIQIIVTNGTFTLSQLTGLTFTIGDGTTDASMTFSGNLSNINAALNNSKFTPTTGFSGNGNIQIKTTDPLCGSDTKSITIIVGNNPPVISSPTDQTICRSSNFLFNAANSNLISVSDADGSNQTISIVSTLGTFTLSRTTDLNFTIGTGTSEASMTFSGTLTNINAALSGAYLNSATSGSGTLIITSNDGAGASTTKTINITVVTSVKPTITTPPANLTVCAGQSATFNVIASYANKYQWQKGGLNISGATGTSYVINSAVAGDEATYTVIVTNGCGSSNSSATLTVTTLPVVSFTGTLTNQCSNSTSYALTGGSPSGGIYSGPGVSGSNFNANVAGVGTHALTYTYTSGSCSNSATNSISVAASPSVNAGAALSAICQGTSTIALGGSFGSTATGAIWSDGSAGGSFTNNSGSTPGTATYLSSSTSSSPVTLTLTSVGGCGSTTASKTLIVNTTPSAKILENIIICEGKPVTLIVELSSNNVTNWSYEYTTSLSGSNPNIVVPVASGSTSNIGPLSPTSTVTYLLKKVTDGNGCIITY
jgi:hypothetical protein